MKLDLGSGPNPAAGHVGVDRPEGDDPPLTTTLAALPCQPRIDARGIVRFDLACGLPWPFEDESIEGLHSSHLIEHLPCADVLAYDRWPDAPVDAAPPDALPDGHRYLRRVGPRDALLRFMDEAWRVTKPGGQFLLRWPALVDQDTGEIQIAPFQDPTHRRFIPLEQVPYWSVEGRKALGVEQYPASCDWRPVSFSQRKHGAPPKYALIENEVILERGPGKKEPAAP